MLGEFLHDLRFSLRSLFRRPSAATLAAVAAMALGIGAAVAIFSVVKTVLLQPLPYPNADRVMVVWNRFTGLGLPRLQLSEPELYDYRERVTSIQDFTAIVLGQGTLTGVEEPERLSYAAVSPSLFPALGVQPSLGRVFAVGEDLPDSQRITVLSDAFWRRRRGADPAAVGSDMYINGNRYIIVGVMPPEFRYPEKVDLWIPLRLDPANPSSRGNHYLNAIARLKPNADPRQVEAEMQTVAQGLQKDFPDFYPKDSGWGVSLTPFHEELTGNIRPALLILLAAVGLVLLIACANVANLQLERVLARSREIAIRTALGEARGRLIRRFITESLVVTFIGGGVGVLIAALAVRALTRIDPASIPRAYDIALDWGVLLFAIALALFSGLVIGLVPAVQTSKLSLTESLKEDGEKSVGGRGRQRVRRVLVVVETALALVLVIGAGLLARTFTHLRQIDPGFETESALTLQIALPTAKYPEEQVASFYEQLLGQVAALPGVRHAGVIDCLPLSGCTLSGSYYVEERMPAPGAVPPESDVHFVSPDYFRAMEIPLKQGRFFSAQDPVESSGGPGVVIVDEEFARRTWPGDNPLGKRVKFDKSPDMPWRIVVGVVGHVKYSSLDATPREQIYVPFSRVPTRDVFLVAKTGNDPIALASPVRELVRRMDPDLPVFDVQTMPDRLVGSLAMRQLSMSLLMSLAILALFLAAVGMYSVIAYSVTERTREIGVRMALGARRTDILGLVVGEGLVMALIGIAAGLTLAYWATKLLGNLLFGISATDIATYLMTSLLLAVTAAAASYFPARKASRVSPMAALGRD
jgi:putative ABC transport system permease protein